jgi:hypothetical protein
MATRTTKITTCEWLMHKGRTGTRRIETLGWGRLARIFNTSEPNSAVRRIILAECRRCGYTPRMILGLNR